MRNFFSECKNKFGEYINAKKSKIRWKDDDVDKDLTWGVIMSGSSFVDLMKEYCPLSEKSDILEIGPGYGRLLDEILKRKLNFKNYNGLEISKTRVGKLKRKYEKNEKCKFFVGDVTKDKIKKNYNYVISSSTFEHLYPDFVSGLINLKNKNTFYCIDFLGQNLSAQHFHDKIYLGHVNKYFVRVYMYEDIIKIFKDNGFNVIATKEISFGLSAKNEEVKRFVVIANT